MRSWDESYGAFMLSGLECVVPKGWKMVCAIREAHHDPTYFHKPRQFDPSRHKKVRNQFQEKCELVYTMVFKPLYASVEVDYFFNLLDSLLFRQEITNPADKPPFFGFGGGPRYCPGAELARLEMSIFLHHLVTKFDLELCGKEKTSFFPIPKMSKGLQVRPRKRINSSNQINEGKFPSITTLMGVGPQLPSLQWPISVR
jgi:cytochrome P450